VLASTKETVQVGVMDPSLPAVLTIDSEDVVQYPDTRYMWGNEPGFGMSFEDREPIRRWNAIVRVEGRNRAEVFRELLLRASRLHRTEKLHKLITHRRRRLVLNPMPHIVEIERANEVGNPITNLCFRKRIELF
jgi:hypothetical protein